MSSGTGRFSATNRTDDHRIGPHGALLRRVIEGTPRQAASPTKGPETRRPSHNVRARLVL